LKGQTQSFDDWKEEGRPRAVKVGKFQLSGMEGTNFELFTAENMNRFPWGGRDTRLISKTITLGAVLRKGECSSDKKGKREILHFATGKIEERVSRNMEGGYA